VFVIAADSSRGFRFPPLPNSAVTKKLD
jgi:hypothetical protein